MKNEQMSLQMSGTDLGLYGLNVVYANFNRSEPFSMEVFQGFQSLRVLTYSASVPMIFRMLNIFERVECIFGYEGILQDFGTILAFQKDLEDRLLVAVKALDDERKTFILEKITQGQAKFFVVKDAVAHSKIYLLENQDEKRVIVGSANLSERAFSGRQAETLLVFDDEGGWQHYSQEYEMVRLQASNEVTLPGLELSEVLLEDIPVVQQAKQAQNGLTLYVNTDVTAATVPTIVRKVEKLADHYNNVTKAAIKPKAGRLELTPKIMGTIVQLVKSHRASEKETQKSTWLSIYRDTRKIFLSGKEIHLEVSPEALRSDVACIIEYFENFKKGFHGNVAQHQKDYFMFMCWFYMAPFICDLRNNAIVNDKFIFDYPMFAIVFGKSNSGKTSLIQTLMMSMFGEWSFVDKEYFTSSNLRGLLASRKRFPVVFDDVDRKRFTNHGADVVKDEVFMLEEYPPFVLSMNAESHSFNTEIIKRCLMLYTSASLPENAQTTRELYQSVSRIRNSLSNALYREYLRRVLELLSEDDLPADMLHFSSEVLISILRENYDAPLPDWCKTMKIADYQSKKYERVQADLRKLYETNRAIWEVRRDEVIIRVPQMETYSFRRDIPDWILRPGSKAGQIVLERRALEEFLEISFRRWRFPFWK